MYSVGSGPETSNAGGVDISFQATVGIQAYRDGICEQRQRFKSLPSASLGRGQASIHSKLTSCVGGSPSIPGELVNELH